MHGLAARVAEVIRIDAVWLACVPVDLRARVDTVLAPVLVTKYADHLPLYRQEAIFARAGQRAMA